jgi:hypothetical protein
MPGDIERILEIAPLSGRPQPPGQPPSLRRPVAKARFWWGMASWIIPLAGLVGGGIAAWAISNVSHDPFGVLLLLVWAGIFLLSCFAGLICGLVALLSREKASGHCILTE